MAKENLKGTRQDDLPHIIAAESHTRRRITPHLFRDIRWFASHPEDYLTVSKKLTHRNLQTTLRVYGCKFGEPHSNGRVAHKRQG